jgi:hypothetical protein
MIRKSVNFPFRSPKGGSAPRQIFLLPLPPERLVANTLLAAERAEDLPRLPRHLAWFYTQEQRHPDYPGKLIFVILRRELSPSSHVREAASQAYQEPMTLESVQSEIAALLVGGGDRTAVMRGLEQLGRLVVERHPEQADTLAPPIERALSLIRHEAGNASATFERTPAQVEANFAKLRREAEENESRNAARLTSALQREVY